MPDSSSGIFYGLNLLRYNEDEERIFLTFLIATGMLIPGRAQQPQGHQSTKAERLAAALSGHRFIFDALTATPQRGIARTLTPGYFFLEVKDDSLICELPFFGRRYSTPSNEELIYGGYQFSTRSYTIAATQGKRGRLELQIATKPFKDELKINLSISKGGWADVQIQSSGREPISYYGSVAPLAEEK